MSTTTTVTVIRFEVRTGTDVDGFEAEGDAQAWAARMAKQGFTATVHRRSEAVTTVAEAWEEIPTAAPEVPTVPAWADDGFGPLA